MAQEHHIKIYINHFVYILTDTDSKEFSSVAFDNMVFDIQLFNTSLDNNINLYSCIR